MRSWLRSALGAGAGGVNGGGGGSASMVLGRRAVGGYRVVAPASSAATTTPAARHAGDATAGTTPADLERYYSLAVEALPEAVRPAVRPLEPDAETQAFLASCRPSLLVSLAARVLRVFLSVTDTNAILARGQMFVLSSAHVRELLQPMLGARPPNSPPPRLLDVGAGDGEVTAKLAPLFPGGVTATEVSPYMARRLAGKGYTPVVTPFLTPEGGFPRPAEYDVVSLFNVLDRCDHPRELLRGAVRLLAPGGRLVIALVLPLCEFVEDGVARRPANGPMPMAGARCRDGASFEASLSAFITRVLWPLGLRVERVARVPYLCRGDMWRPWYVLADSILVCEVAEGGEGESEGGAGGVVAGGADEGSGAAEGRRSGGGGAGAVPTVGRRVTVQPAPPDVLWPAGAGAVEWGSTAARGGGGRS